VKLKNLKKKGITLVNDTIDNTDIDQLCLWLKTYPQLTKGPQTLEFEKQFSTWLGCKYSVFVNSGSSANLAAVYALKCSGRLRSNNIVVPAVSWSTTVSPLIQLGFNPIFCDCCKDTLGLDTKHLTKILNDNTIYIGAVMLVHVLGFPCKMDEIQELCWKEGIPLIEDSCETMGSEYGEIKCGNFGLMSTFSFYFSHVISTIEGGMVSTNDKELYDILLMIRSHGWSKDNDVHKQKELREEHNISKFKEMYTFYHPSFNIRSTDLQAYIGIGQLKKLDNICNKRYENLTLYDNFIKNDYWKIPFDYKNFISNFAYPIISPKRDEIAKALTNNNIENRPLVCGNMINQPFCKDIITYKIDLPFADIVDKYGLYVPNNPDLTEEDIKRICNIVNGVINE
jgi:CDP-6-deoxy-D-xylo-4-hexulose-3-dehydrase